MGAGVVQPQVMWLAALASCVGLRGALETGGDAQRGHVPGTELRFGGSSMCCVFWGRGPRGCFARRDHGARHQTQAAGKGAGKVGVVLCGLRTSVFFVIREAMGGLSFNRYSRREIATCLKPKAFSHAEPPSSQRADASGRGRFCFPCLALRTLRLCVKLVLAIMCHH